MAETEKRVITIGTRKSQLAMIQAHHVLSLLQAAHPSREFRLNEISTSGDKELGKPLAELAGKNPGLFTKELEVELISGVSDMAVHSLKDMPTSLPDGLILACITEVQIFP